MSCLRAWHTLKASKRSVYKCSRVCMCVCMCSFFLSPVLFKGLAPNMGLKEVYLYVGRRERERTRKRERGKEREREKEIVWVCVCVHVFPLCRSPFLFPPPPSHMHTHTLSIFLFHSISHTCTRPLLLSFALYNCLSLPPSLSCSRALFLSS